MIDWYTKFILTVIAALLLGILIKPSISPQKAEAGPGEYVYVENSSENAIPVWIVNQPVAVNGNVVVSNSWSDPLYIKGAEGTY